jgi:hypothetical protein
VVGLPEEWCRVPGGGVGGVGRVGGMSFVVQMPPLSCRAEYARITAGQTPTVTDQDLRQSVAWLGNRQCLEGVMARLLLPARHLRPVVAVVARGGILIGHGVGPKGAWYANPMAAAEAADEEAEAHIILCVVFVWWCVRKKAILFFFCSVSAADQVC